MEELTLFDKGLIKKLGELHLELAGVLASEAGIQGAVSLLESKFTSEELSKLVLLMGILYGSKIPNMGSKNLKLN